MAPSCAKALGQAQSQGRAYLVVLVYLGHTALALLLRDDLSGVLHDDLMRLKAAVASHTVASISRLDHLHTDAVFASLGPSSRQIRKGAICAISLSGIAVRFVALVEHDAVLTALAAAIVGFADTFGLIVVDVRQLPPDALGSTDESICNASRQDSAPLQAAKPRGRSVKVGGLGV